MRNQRIAIAIGSTLAIGAPALTTTNSTAHTAHRDKISETQTIATVATAERPARSLTRTAVLPHAASIGFGIGLEPVGVAPRARGEGVPVTV